MFYMDDVLEKYGTDSNMWMKAFYFQRFTSFRQLWNYHFVYNHNCMFKIFFVEVIYNKTLYIDTNTPG